MPGARYGAVSWVDGSGNFWLFGGEGRGAVSSFDVPLSDLWKWNGTSWTWVSGPNVGEQNGVYGTMGVPAPGNRPGARRDASAWRDATGNLWLFGGNGRGASLNSRGPLNDLWRWDGAAWTWMGGASGYGQAGAYGTKGVANPANYPGGRYGTAASVGPDGKVRLFGGYGASASGTGWLNDLWIWNGAGWIWLSGSNGPNQPGAYGTKGVAAPGNVPGARVGAVSWTDAGGSFFLLGGQVDPLPKTWASLSDVWKWDGVNWTWVGGASTPDQPGTYGTKSMPDAGNEPGARGNAVVSQASGSVFLFGGRGASSTGRIGALNDLWRWNGVAWTWLSGSNGASEAGVYGTKGLASPANHPGARTGAVTWRTADGKSWLFGGFGYSAAGLGYLNDLWRWDGSTWTWVGGSDFEEQAGVFGTKGVPAPANVPGARSDAVSWVDAGGNLWLFGGVNDPWEQSLLNDLWKWDGTNWTWVSGSQTAGNPGTYGTKGVPAPANVPPCRHGAVSWTDANSNLWLFGGDGWPVSPGPELNDLWRWDGTNWTWMSGANDGSVDGYFGAQGVPAPENAPRGRVSAAAWVDLNGNFWLFGGTNYGYYMNLNDLWRWDGAYWTWMSGAAALNQPGVYGDLGVPSPANTPGGRREASSWADAQGRFWLLGGKGWDSTAAYGTLRDLWTYEPPACVPPSAVITAPDSLLEGSGAQAASVPDAGAGATYEWTITRGTLDSGQGTPAVTFSATPGETSVVVAVVVRKGDCAASREKTIPIGVYFRLDVVRNGSGSDQVVSSAPVGSEISCDLSCSAVLASGSSVTLSPRPGPNSRFAGWLGGGCSGTDLCVVTMDAAKTVSATFFQKAAAGLYTVTPCRIVDTRNPAGPWGAPALEAGATRAFAIGGVCGVPADATAAALNVTITGATGAGSLTVFPGTGPAPETSSIHFAAGKTRANNVTMGLAAGILSVLDRQAEGTVELIIDVSGYYR